MLNPRIREQQKTKKVETHNQQATHEKKESKEKTGNANKVQSKCTHRLERLTTKHIPCIIFQYIYMIFAYVGAWRSASNYKPKKKQWAWGSIAQIYMTLSIIRTIVEIIKSLNI